MQPTMRIESARIRGVEYKEAVTFVVKLPDGKELETHWWVTRFIAKGFLQDFSRTGLLPTPDMLYYRRDSRFGRWMIKERFA
jgi:hypothetical protein